MRRALLLVWMIPCVALAGCAQPGGTTEEEPWLPEQYTRIMASTDEDPLSWHILYLPGLDPPVEVSSGVDEQLDRVFGPEAHRYRGSSPLDVESDGQWSSGELHDLATQLHDAFFDPHLLIVFLDGQHADEPDGTSYLGVESNHVAFVFSEQVWFARIGDIAVDDPAKAKILRSVAVHESGHVLGLVGREAEMLNPRLAGADEDPCRCHSRYEESVMYFQAHTSEWYLEPIDGDGSHIRYEFDEHDLADLAHARELALQRHRD